MSILWTIIVGFVAGIIAKLIHPGPNEPSGFVLTTILGIVGAFVATFAGQALGWYRADEGAAHWCGHRRRNSSCCLGNGGAAGSASHLVGRFSRHSSWHRRCPERPDWSTRNVRYWLEQIF